MMRLSSTDKKDRNMLFAAIPSICASSPKKIADTHYKTKFSASSYRRRSPQLKGATGGESEEADHGRAG